MAMASVYYDMTSGDPLPPGGPPNLYPFKDRHEQIEVLQLISDSSDAPSNSETGEGSSQAHVFKIRVGQTLYALKVFKFQSASDLRRDNFPNWNGTTDDATLVFQTDPFFAECRAYGRIDEFYRGSSPLSLRSGLNKPAGRGKATRKKVTSKTANKKSSNRARVANTKKRKLLKDDSPQYIAVPCYGYVGLPAEPFQRIFRKKFGIAEWNRPEWDENRPAKSQLPLRGLVKELVEHQPAIANPPKMLRDFKKLRRIGVYQMDVAERNYLGGLLVDFGLAWTIPYWAIAALGVRGGTLAERYKHDDLIDFDDMLAEADVKVDWRVRATRNEDTIDKLRPRRDR